jgi:hypothetical protein
VGSGYGTALARRVVGRDGLVVAIELDAATLAFARENLDRAGYTDVVLVYGDGGLGHAEHAPYDRICVTAACPNIPPPLIGQLAVRGRLIAPVKEGTRQLLTLVEKTPAGVRREVLTDVLYVSLRGRYGVAATGRAEGSGGGQTLCFVGEELGRAAACSSRQCDGPSHATCAIRARAPITGVSGTARISGVASLKGAASGARVVPTTPAGHRTAGAGHPTGDSSSLPQRPQAARLEQLAVA